jgi:hypothetical protein
MQTLPNEDIAVQINRAVNLLAQQRADENSIPRG